MFKHLVQPIDLESIKELKTPGYCEQPQTCEFPDCDCDDDDDDYNYDDGDSEYCQDCGEHYEDCDCSWEKDSEPIPTQNDSYQLGYQQGYNEASEQLKAGAYKEGYDTGYDSGKEIGFNEGYAKAIAEIKAKEVKTMHDNPYQQGQPEPRNPMQNNRADQLTDWLKRAQKETSITEDFLKRHMRNS